MCASEVLNRAAPGLRLALLLAVAHASCGGESQDDTLIVLEVDSDLAIPAQLDRIDITVSAPGKSEVSRSFPVERKTMLPVKLALIPEGNSSGTFKATVVARAAGRESLRQEIETTFVPDEARRLPIVLRSGCLTVSCPDRQTCREKQCQTLSAGVTLLPLEKDGGVPPDGPVKDGGAPADGPVKDGGAPADACRGLTCNNTCVNSQTDPKHCGTCNTVCEGACVMGACEPIYNWLVIVDSSPDLLCSTSSGPGADIDSIQVSRAGGPSSVGLRGSAVFTSTFMNVSTPGCERCEGGSACAYSNAASAHWVEGPPDARSNQGLADSGYLSLNGGLVWLQVGDATGGGKAQSFKRGDTLTVHEVGQEYVGSTGRPFVTCRCTPEPYAVFAYREKDPPTGGTKLVATGYRPENTDGPDECSPTVNSMLGCGTTVFQVP
jgi:hypothetical protein